MIQLVNARIFHERVRPRSNRFCYSALYCVAQLEDLAEPHLGLFAVDRPGLFTIRTQDYGEAGVTPARHIRRILDEWNLVEADGAVKLMTLPRVLGYGFNPVSFWLCHDNAGGLRAVLAEVNNTFGERHSYLCCHDDHHIIEASDTMVARKMFHVSPFIAVKGDYAFHFSIQAQSIAITIELQDESGLLLRTAVAGRTEMLSTLALLRTLLKNPLYPFKVIGLIHYQAVKLFLKGIRHLPKPLPPAARISHG